MPIVIGEFYNNLNEDNTSKEFYQSILESDMEQGCILHTKGYWKLVDKYVNPSNVSWDEEQTYPTIDTCIRSENLYGLYRYAYKLDPKTYKVSYIGMCHITKLEDEGYSVVWDKDNLSISAFNKKKNISEAAMSSKERNELSDDSFGIPSQRKYPLNDKKHVEQAIKMFNHVDDKHESELADNILDAMEKYHISTDVVGDKNRLKKYIKEETIYEGLIWNDNTPNDIKKLKMDIREDLKKPENIKDLIDKAKDSVKNVDFKSDEKKAAYKVLRRNGVNICGYSIKTSTYGSFEISNTHTLIGTYKNYILSIQFIGAKGNLGLGTIIINYDKNKSDIPKDVAFNFISILSPNVLKIKCTRRSINISATAENVDSAYPMIDHKYSKKYKVKKIPGMSITLSTMKSVREDSLVAAALPRDDFQPNSVYIVNYLNNNTFEKELAICKDKMSNIFTCTDQKPELLSLSDFKKIASEIKVYKYNGDCDFKSIVESSHSGVEFYQNIVNDSNVKIDDLDNDYRFTRESSYLDELNSIEECILNSAPHSGIINEVYCPILPLVNLNESDSSVQYFRDINGIFAQNVDTLARSASYKSADLIPETTINLLKNI